MIGFIIPSGYADEKIPTWVKDIFIWYEEEQISEDEHEWKLNTKQKVKDIDPDIFKLLTDPQYRLPTVLPDGTYNPTT